MHYSETYISTLPRTAACSTASSGIPVPIALALNTALDITTSACVVSLGGALDTTSTL